MSTDPIERLRVDVPTLEPDPVLLDRLVSASMTASTAPPVLPRVLLAAAAVAAIAATAWGVTQLPTGGNAPAPAEHSTRPSPSPDRQGGASPTQIASTGPGGAVLPGAAAPGSAGSPDTPSGPAGGTPAVGGSSGASGSSPAAGGSDPASSAPGAGDRPGRGRGRSEDPPGKRKGEDKGHHGGAATPGTGHGAERKVGRPTP